MNEEVTYTVNFLTWLSMLVFLTGWAVFAGPLLYRGLRRIPDQRRGTRFHLLLVATLAAVLLFEFSKQGEIGSTVFIRMLQSFTTDADYEFMGRQVLADSGWLRGLTAVFRTLLYTSAPILGGALVYEVFAGLSPKLRLFRVFRRFPLYVFSELNARSVTLAEDVLRQKPDGRLPVIVFTDCYVDSADESASELLTRARALRAVCIREDIAHAHLVSAARDSRCFLMDTTEAGELDDESNLIALQALLSWKPDRMTARLFPNRSGDVYFFSDDSASILSVCVLDVERRSAGESRPAVHVVRDYALSCCRQLREKPLFLALPRGEDGRVPEGRPLRVAVLGDGPYAREMFKTVFWCGQLLAHPLELAVIGHGGRGRFLSWLDALSPELLKSCESGDPLLNAGLDGDPMPPYASLGYVRSGLTRGELKTLLDRRFHFLTGPKEEYSLAEFDYFLVMTASDLENIRLAEELGRCLCLRNREKGEQGRQIIAAAVETQELRELTRALDGGPEQQEKSTDRPEMVCFGALADRYNWEDIDSESRAYAPAEAKPGGVKHSDPDQNATQGGRIYDAWSTLTREVHLPYKMFSLCGETDGGPAGKVRYWAALSGDLKASGGRAAALTWLEHRRWCAFMRCLGFTQPPRLTEYLREQSEGTFTRTDKRWIGYKDVRARTHPNLLECSVGLAGTRDLLDLAGELRALMEPQQPPEQKQPDPRPYADKRPSRLKKYDIPFCEYSPCVSGEALRTLAGTEPDPEKLKLCRRKGDADVYYLDLIEQKDPELYEKLKKGTLRHESDQAL